MYCQYCGAMIPDEAKICMGCGCPVPPTPPRAATPTSAPTSCHRSSPLPFDMTQEAVPGDGATVENPMVSPRSGIVTLLLLLILGHFGVHRFYVGKVGSGLGMLALCIVSFGSILSFCHLGWGDYDVCQPWNFHFMPLAFVAKMCSLAILVWWVIDLIHILTSKFTDSRGLTIKL